jgi:hypothetical protein
MPDLHGSGRRRWLSAGFAAAAFGMSELHATENSDAGARPEVPFFSLGARLGVVPWGTGEQKNECAGPCAMFAPDDATYSHLPAFVVGVDALFGAFDRFRFGLGVLYVPTSSIRLAGASRHFEVGSDVDIDAVAEGVVRATPRVWILPRLQGGLLVLSPGGDLRTTLDGLHRDCSGLAQGCDSLTGAYTGWNLAAGGGALWVSSERLRVRADLLFQYYSVPLYTITGTLAGEPIEVSERLAGGRMFLTIGAEVF